jgi:hypothetical protein
MRALIGNCWSRIKIFADLPIEGNDKLLGKQTQVARGAVSSSGYLARLGTFSGIDHQFRNVLKFSQHLREIGAWTARSD